MVQDHWLILVLLTLSLLGFVFSRLRHDLVAMSALLCAVFLGLVPADTAFEGFGHPAVITVALVLILSEALQRSHILEYLEKPLEQLADHPVFFTAALCSLGMLLSGFMNNVGALALLMPLALRLAQNPSRVLMPLSFATILGGLITLVGTPPNLIISAFRQQQTGYGYALFDFAYVGLPIAFIGLCFILLVGWRLIPKERRGKLKDRDFINQSYVTEVVVTEGNELIGLSVEEIESQYEPDLRILALLRKQERFLVNIITLPVQVNDILVVRASTQELADFLKQTGFKIWGSQEFVQTHIEDKSVKLCEAVVSAGSTARGRTAKEMGLRRIHGVNLLGIARQGNMIEQRIAHTPLHAGDVVLLQGTRHAAEELFEKLNWIALKTSRFTLGQVTINFWPLAFFIMAIAASALEFISIHIAFALTVGVCVLFKHLPVERVYTSIDWSIVVLLAAMIPLGAAFEESGGTQLLMSALIPFTSSLPPAMILMILMFITMNLSDVMNNAATTVVMAPIAIGVAQSLNYGIDAFLMAIAVAASCAFKTPIGHQNNLLVMGAGGYKFHDYWRMGLPLQLIIILAAPPLLLRFWPV